MCNGHVTPAYYTPSLYSPGLLTFFLWVKLSDITENVQIHDKQVVIGLDHVRVQPFINGRLFINDRAFISTRSALTARVYKHLGVYKRAANIAD